MSYDVDEDSECPHGLGDPAWCAACKKVNEPPPTTEFVGCFRAKWSGQCRLCNLPVVQGAWCKKMMVGDRSLGAVHEACADEHERKEEG